MSSDQIPTRSIRYRPEIDGLRTIAVVAVVLYHADFTLAGEQVFSGGFIGVDIFFVISGFLITRLLVKDLKQGNFSILSFYERRARRILPALLCVMLVTAPLCWIFMTPNALIESAKSIAASLAFSSNIFFWLQDSYTAEPSQLKPFLHTWSLSLEEQFYVVFPIALYFIWHRARDNMVVILFFCCLASLVLAQFLSGTYSDANFFLMPSRAWELLLGSLLAIRCDALQRVIPEPVSRHLPTLGIIAMIWSIMAFTDTMPHPSFWTLIPVLGACAVIAFANRKDPATNLLSTRPMVGCGLISYSFYLWHFPIFALGRITLGRDLDMIVTSIFIVLSLGLAYLTWTYVETPYRDRTRTSLPKFTSLAVITTAILLANAGLAIKEIGIDRYAMIPEKVALSFKEWINPSNPNFRCVDQQEFLESGAWCSLGTPKPTPDFLLVGDSHSLAQAAHFDAAAKKLDHHGLLVSRSGCPLLFGLTPSRGVPASENCLKLAHKVFDYARENSVRAVFLSLRWNYYYCGEPEPDCGYTQKTRLDGGPWSKDREARFKNISTALERTVQAYADSGIKLYLIAEVPHQPRAAKDIYSDYFQDPRPDSLKKMSVTFSDHQNFTSDLRNLLATVSNKHALVFLIDQSSVLCPQQDVCLVGTPETSYYRDEDHLSQGALMVLAPWTEQQLVSAMRTNKMKYVPSTEN